MSVGISKKRQTLIQAERNGKTRVGEGCKTDNIRPCVSLTSS